jgi:glycosyltransferase involved in cell wall biosynthesis
MLYPLVTIGIPTYNRANSYFRKTLESALSQTYSNVEIVISDNCSPDDTESVVQQYSGSRIRYYRQNKNISVNDNFNYCLKQAKGEYFLLLHDDDIIDDDFVETCLEACDYKTDVGIIRTGARIIDADGKVRGEEYNKVDGLSTLEFVRGWFASKTSFYFCSTLFNTEKLKAIGGFGSKRNLFQDVVAAIQLAAMHGRADVEEIKASFRKHGEEITFSVKVDAWCDDSLMVLDMICDLFPKSRSTIKREGRRFLAKLNYNTASKVKLPWQRFCSYLIVFKYYNFRFLPPPITRRLRLANTRIRELFSL